MATNTPGRSSRRLLAGHHVARPGSPGHLAVAEHLGARPMSHRKSIFALAKARSCMIFEARSSLRRWMRVTLRGEAGQEERLFEGGVAAADDDDLLVAEEEPVTGGAGGHAVAEQPGLAGHVQHERPGPGGHDQGPGRDVGLAVAVDVGPDPEGRELTGRPWSPCGSRTWPRSAPPGPGSAHELGADDAVDEARVVLDLGGEHQLAAGLVAGGRRLALDHQGLQVGPGRVDGGGEPGRARPEDDRRRGSRSRSQASRRVPGARAWTRRRRRRRRGRRRRRASEAHTRPRKA